jgi:apolipoprotein N-acyltransferase
MNDLSRRALRWLSARPSRARLAVSLGGALATAALLALYGRVEAPFFVLAFFALVPWLLALDRATTLREALVAGALMSITFVALVFSWLPATAQGYAHAASPLPAWLVMLVAAPLIEPQFLAFALVRHLVRQSPRPRPALRAALAGACVYVAAELLLPKLFFDTLGQGLYPSLRLRQAADIAGVHGLTLLLLLVNEGIAATIRESAAGRRRLLPLAGALGLVLLGYAYGSLRYAQIQARSGAPPLVVGLVQANITNYDKMRAEKGAFETVRAILDTHYALSDEMGAAHPDLLLWPETVYPTTFGSPRSEAGAAFDEEIGAFVAQRDVPLVFGAYDTEGSREFNAAFFLARQKDGHVGVGRYRKRMLFPLTEWVPGALDSAFLRELLPWTGHWERGPGPEVVRLDLRGGRLISLLPLICYDALFPDFVAEAASKEADLIVTLSNDSWFPDERAPRLHLLSAAFRSVETRLPQVRATNSGISAMITPLGEIVAATRWDARQTLVASLPSAGRMATLAVALGPWLGPLLLVAAIVLVVHARRGMKPGAASAARSEAARGAARARGRNKRAGKAPR